ncbi:MAG TPA: hypothetical protein PLB96_00725 [Syntrophales bacterium]|nr:hypothetical protein [Syntrophales bacterium]
MKNSLALPAAYRLAFRELGLSIGLHGVRRLRTLIEENPGISGNGMPLHGRVEALLRYERLASAIEAFWLDAASREASSWRDHGDINDVMLATSLAPDGFLKL